MKAGGKSVAERQQPERDYNLVGERETKEKKDTGEKDSGVKF